MTTGLGPGRDDQVHARGLERAGFVYRGRGANGGNAESPAPIKERGGRDAEDEAEDRRPDRDERGRLILERRIRVGGNVGGSTSSSAKSGASGARAASKMARVMSDAAASAVETHRFTANGASVRDRMSATTARMASGVIPCAPNNPSPPTFDTAAASCGDDSPPPNGP